MANLLDGLPQLYQRLLPELFSQPVPAEEKATCSNCAMCQPKESVEPVDGRSRFFRADTKCCTYHPRLPNYLVGGLLSDPDPQWAEGQRRMRERIAGRVAISPQWVRPPAKYSLFYSNQRNAFGKSASLLCPFFEKDGGLCTIWPYRETVCSTYYCKYVAGADGRNLWTSVKTFLTLVEVQLTRYAILEVDKELLLSAEDQSAAGSPGPLSAEALDDLPLPPRDYQRHWRNWVGREEEFYRACHQKVTEVDRAKLEQILGLDGTIELQHLTRRHAAATSSQLPRTLRFNPATTVSWLPDHRVALACYSEVDAIALPGDAYAMLVRFTGKEPVAKVRGDLRQQLSQDLSDEILLTLYQHRVLIEA